MFAKSFFSMAEYSFFSIIPPIASIVVALFFRQVHVSLLTGIYIGWLSLNDFNPIRSFFSMLDSFIVTLTDSGNLKTIMFCILVGGIIQLMEDSGGVKGLVSKITKFLESKKNLSKEQKKKKIQVFTLFTGLILFIETSISCLATGALFKPLFEKHKISKQKLAYLIDSSSSPSSIIFPFNGWGAFIIGLLAVSEIENPTSVLIDSLPWNFYPFFTIITAFLVVRYGINLGSMKQYETSIASEKEEETKEGKQGFKNKKNTVWTLLLPMSVMILLMPVFLIYTGTSNIPPEPFSFSFLSKAFLAGSGSTSVFYSVSTTIAVLVFQLLIQKQDSIHVIMNSLFKGFSNILSLGSLILFAFALSGLCKELGTAHYIAQIATKSVPVLIIPALIFLLSGIIAFSTGTSWGTYAIMLPISIQLGMSFGLPVELVLACCLGGGIFGDHASPISDTTLLASLASGCDHVEHVKTQLPYALIVGGISIFAIIVGTAIVI